MSDIVKIFTAGFSLIFILFLVMFFLLCIPLKGYYTYNINDLEYLVSDNFEFVHNSYFHTIKKSHIRFSKKDFSYVSVGKNIFNIPSDYTLFLTYDDYKKFFGVDYET